MYLHVYVHERRAQRDDANVELMTNLWEGAKDKMREGESVYQIDAIVNLLARENYAAIRCKMDPF